MLVHSVCSIANLSNIEIGFQTRLIGVLFSHLLNESFRESLHTDAVEATETLFFGKAELCQEMGVPIDLGPASNIDGPRDYCIK